MTTVLIVSDRPDIREALGRFLEDDGMQVLSCCGPSAPTYQCVGASGHCTLPEAAEVVALNQAGVHVVPRAISAQHLRDEIRRLAASGD